LKNDAVCIETLAGNQEGKGNRKKGIIIKKKNLLFFFKKLREF